MFRDKEEELQRLQVELLQEEQTARPEEEFPAEEDFEELLWDTDQGENPQVYQNYSNDYGKNLRNFASGYRAYNTDKTDTDLDRYSEQVQECSKTPLWWIWLLLLIMLLMASVVAAIAWMFFSTGGIG